MQKESKRKSAREPAELKTRKSGLGKIYGNQKVS